MASPTQSKGSASNSFFSRLKEAAGEGLTEGLSNALPRWVDKTLNQQSVDQLDNSTFDASKSPPRIDQIRPALDENRQTTTRGKIEAMGINPMFLGVGVVVLLIGGAIIATRR